MNLMQDTRSPWIMAGVTLLLFVAMVAYGWVGYLASDDAIYASGAYGWLDEFPYVGGHGSIRYTITVPIALSFLAFGGGEVSLALPTILYACGLVALLVLTVLGAIGATAAWLVALLLVMQPILVTASSLASIDVVEAFFIFASLVCFHQAAVKGATWPRLLAAGALMGGAFLSRETAVFAILFYGVLFLFGYGFARLRYFIMAAGFMAVWGLELIYLWAMTGDPLYRINIALNHDQSIDRTIDVAGNVIVHPLVDPLLVILLNQEFGVLFWCAIPCGIWLALRKTLPSAERRLLVLFGGLAVVWFLAAGGAQSSLPLNPRYFFISALGACVVLGVGLNILLHERRPRLALGVLALVLCANFAGIYIENRNFTFGEKALARLAAQYDEPLYTDPETRNRAFYRLKWNGTDDRVRAGIPPAGGLYAFNPPRVSSPGRLIPRSELETYQPKCDWRLVEERMPEPKLVGRVARWLGVDDMVPGVARNAFFEGHPGVRLYRVP